MTLQEDNHNCNYQHQESEIKFLSEEPELLEKIEGESEQTEAQEGEP